ncbi:hypothetical protein [Idiomarina sp.]|uniref:hypothetical protein n=1 Tax=Idiomarina sp. TaxID=1874361 RepID=UPI003A8D31A2
MIPAYQEHLKLLLKRLPKLGFQLTKDNDYTAEFLGNDGWKIIFEGERYNHSLYGLWLVHTDSEGHTHEYVLWLLSRAFQKIGYEGYSDATLDGRLDWLEENTDKIFTSDRIYWQAYNELNKVKN